MTRSDAKAIAFALLLIAGALAFMAAALVDLAETDRYALGTIGNGGVIRMDNRTGKLASCDIKKWWKNSEDPGAGIVATIECNEVVPVPQR